jgi:hypothetical protein
MAWTQADADALQAAISAAIANGSWQVQTVQFGDQAIALRSLTEAMDLLAKIQAAASATAGGLTKYLVTGKGV